MFCACSREALWTDMDKELDDDILQRFIVAYDDYVIKKKPLEYVL
jgi:hypothetical protein